MFDLDAKKVANLAAMHADLTQLLAWLDECGARYVIDYSTTTGGVHVYMPLPLGLAVTRNEIEPLLRVIGAHLPSLDLTPMLGHRAGAIAPPGSVTKEGGVRALVGSLGKAIEAYTVRSEPGVLGRLTALLGVSTTEPSPTTPRANATAGAAPSSLLFDRDGEAGRLRPAFRWHGEIPAPVLAFATTGALPSDRRFASRSEARASVLCHAIMRGMSLADVRAREPHWHGLFDSYRYDARGRHRPGYDVRITRDWESAKTFAAVATSEVQLSTHKISRHTGGGRPASTPSVYSRWLADAQVWASHHWSGSGHRWVVAAVLQGLAWAAAVSKERAKDIPVTEVGVRSLSVMCGLMPETTVAAVLREIRDMPGSPLLRVRRGAGTLADRYALVAATTPTGAPLTADEISLARVRVEPVSPAWREVGLRAKLVYELITHTGLTHAADVAAAAGISRSSCFDIVTQLRCAGLIAPCGPWTAGALSLDEFATRRGLPRIQAATIARHQRERAQWVLWLAIRFGQSPDDSIIALTFDSSPPAHPWDREDDWAWEQWIHTSSSPDPGDQTLTSSPDSPSTCEAFVHD
ncbi:hypothetical protein AB0L82_35320 [Nocardia sp. NPDC052001]|uniref:hypothetical protein n=1 Tax=Nocardia sp. NPDC052001 TaxID=3154853 RepID=UPI003418CF65